MTFEQRVELALGSLQSDLRAPVTVELEHTTPSHVFAVVTSEGFGVLDDIQRQRLVWGKLLDLLDDEDRRRVEFVFTISPNDAADAAL